MRTRDRPSVVVIGASAGGVEALVTIAASLPADFAAAVFVVLHLPESGRSVLPELLDRAGPLPAVRAVDGAAVTGGVISVAPANHHVIVGREDIRVSRGPKVNGYRPAVDVLFHSAAAAFGRLVTGVVLSGTLDDGTLGLRAIKNRGGRAVVQADALHQGMPTSAIRNVEIDAVIPLRDIAARLTMFISSDQEASVDDETVDESELEAGFDLSGFAEPPGAPSTLRCPECGGALWELEDGPFSGYVCHVGHSFSADSLLHEQGHDVERALWRAVRLLEERATLNERLAERVGTKGSARSGRQFRVAAGQATADADTIRRILQAPEHDEQLEESGEAA